MLQKKNANLLSIYIHWEKNKKKKIKKTVGVSFKKRTHVHSSSLL